MEHNAMRRNHACPYNPAPFLTVPIPPPFYHSTIASPLHCATSWTRQRNEFLEIVNQSRDKQKTKCSPKINTNIYQENKIKYHVNIFK